MLQIIERALKDIKPDEKNPRNNKRAVEPVKKSIQEFGFRVPIIIDGEGVIVAGHTRYLAAKELKMKTVPTVSAADMSEEQVKAYRLVDNKTNEFATWDFDLMQNELAGIFDIDMSAFDFGATNVVDELYKGMPEYEDENPNDRKIVMHFRNDEDVQDFARLIRQEVTEKTSFLWHPKMERQDKKAIAYEDIPVHDDLADIY
jgi:site-specific DNA-methyltransferase (adenine-specific)